MQVLIQLLPGGVDEALVRVREFQSTTDQFANGMGLTILNEPRTAHGILALAEDRLAGYVVHQESRIRWSS